MADEVTRGGLKQATLDGVRWVAVARGAAEIVAFGSGVVLAHLVPPAEFGRLAVAVILNELALSLAAEGIGSALVQRKQIDRAHIESATLASIVFAVILMAATLFVIAPLVADPLFGAETADLFRLFAPVFLIAGLRIVPQAQLQRRLDFRRISRIEIVGTLIGAGTSVGLAAWAGLDAEAYVLGMLASGIAVTVLLFRATGMALPRWHPRELRELLSFGAPAAVAGASWVSQRNVDYAILGARLGPVRVGQYYRAFTLGVENEQRISGIVARVMFPVYSRTEDLHHMRDVRARITRVNACVIFPLLALFIAVAPVFVPWLFGSRWDEAVLPAQILAAGGMAQTLGQSTGPMVLAAGKARVLSVFNLCQFALYGVTVYFAAGRGLTAVCIAVSVYYALTVVVGYRFLLRRYVAMPAGQLTRDAGPALVGSAVTLLAALGLVRLGTDAGLPALAILAPVGVLGVALYALVLRALFPASYADIRLLAAHVLPERFRRPRRMRRTLLATTLCLVGLTVGAQSAGAVTYPAGFQDQALTSGLTRPTAAAWAPDGRIFITEQGGTLKVLNPGGSSATTILDISGHVNQFSDRGLLGLALDKNFATNGFAYLLYTYDVTPGNPDSSGQMVSRLARVTISPSNTVSAETTILGSFVSGPCPAPANSLDCLPSEGDSHSIGTVRMDPADGSLFVGVGDGAGYGGVDTDALRSYNEVVPSGKILHVDTTGKGLAGHAFCPADADLTHVCTKIYAKGFRNPFRFQLRPGGGLIVGDVGWNTTEEVDLITAAGKNYGWPCYEGPFHTVGYQDLSQCSPEYAKEGTATADTGPDHSYAHSGTSHAVVGGPVYNGNQYPSSYRGTAFVGDYAAAYLQRLELDAQGHVSAVRDFATSWFGTDLETAPDGNIAFVNYGTGAAGTGSLREIVYTAGDLTPIAQAAGNPSSGNVPLTVNFSSAGSSDPDGDTLTYDWDFGDGTSHSTAANPAHTYSAAGNYTAKLTVNDGRGKTASATVPIAAGNSAPTVKIDSPADNSLFRDGSTIQLRGSATDPQDGTLPGTALSWHVILHHSTHIHPIVDVDGTAATSFDARTDHDSDSYYDVTLTAKDSAGLTSSTTISLKPETIAFGLNSSPQGAPVSYAGTAQTAPFATRSTIGFATTITAGSSFSSGGHIWNFDHWSNGGARAQNLTIPTVDTQLTTVYSDGGVDTGGVCYPQAVLGTTGLRDYWRMGDTSGSTFADSKGANPALNFGATLGVPGAIAGDTDKAARFNGLGNYASAPLNLSDTNVVSVEFWLKWNAFANDDKLAFEFTPNSNNNPGGFDVDPDESASGKFEAAHRQGPANSGYNALWFNRPSAQAWHHYVLVYDKSAPAAGEVNAYVDGVSAGGATRPFTTENLDSFVNSTLYFMSRGGTSLFGGGDLDEVAVYGRALTAPEAADHYSRGTTGSCTTNQAPNASFTAAPNPATVGQTVTFDASGSNDPDGSIAKYEWDLDGNGTFETDTGTTPTTSKPYGSAGTVNVALRVTDNRGTTMTATKPVVVNAGNQSPAASFTATPNPVQTGATVTFNGSGSNDPDGSIAKYEWDLDGNGSYETDTNATPTTSKVYAAAGNVTVGLRVTDNAGATGTTTRTVTVQTTAPANYSQTILGTTGLRDYWRLGETSGSTFADSKGTATATAVNGPVLGVPGAIAGDSDRAARFDGTNDYARANLSLSDTNVVTLEFWLKWNAFAGDDRLAFEYTANSNVNPGGFLVDPNESGGGKFEVSHRQGAFNSGYNALWFNRPTAAAWHHYVLVLNKGAAAASELTAYVDGANAGGTHPFATENTDSFVNSTLYFMSRGGTSLFGAGDLDEVAVYGRALTAAEAQDHYTRGTTGGGGTNQPPAASFTASPNPAATGQTVSFNAGGSLDPDGTIAKYEWDLDGNGSYETDTGTTPTTSKAYATAGNVTVGLRVTDNGGATATTTKPVTITATNQSPTASFTVSPNPANTGQTVTFNGSASLDPDGTIAKYEWDLDGNGSYETNGGATPTTSKSYATAGSVTVGLRVTDGPGATGTTTRALTVNTAGASTYAPTILGTSGLRDYWRLGETSGVSLADSKGTATATAVNGPVLGVPGAIANDADRAVRFDGTNDYARANLSLSDTNVVTLEFWLKWNAFANDDRLAFEYTANSNVNPGGLLVDPNESGGGKVEASHRQGPVNTGYNALWFNRPTPGAWHHYALVFNKGAPAASELTAYVDGANVGGTHPFATENTDSFVNSTLYFMSRGGTSLFGAGDLDEVAVYGRALTAAEAQDHYTRGVGG